ncbi:MAG: hypothetical protein U1U88_000282 [Lawsonella clevelandensis]
MSGSVDTNSTGLTLRNRRDSHRIDTAWQWENHDNQNVIAEGWASPTLYASYLHTHPVARPAVAERFVHAAQHYHKTREGNA